MYLRVGTGMAQSDALGCRCCCLIFSTALMPINTSILHILGARALDRVAWHARRQACHVGGPLAEEREATLAIRLPAWATDILA